MSRPDADVKADVTAGVARILDRHRIGHIFLAVCYIGSDRVKTDWIFSVLQYKKKFVSIGHLQPKLQQSG